MGYQFSTSAYSNDVVLVPDVGVFENGDGEKWSFNELGSPDWTRLLFPNEPGLQMFSDWQINRLYLTEKEAKDVLRSEPKLVKVWIIPSDITQSTAPLVSKHDLPH